MRFRVVALAVALACGFSGLAEAKKKPNYKAQKYKPPKTFKATKFKPPKLKVPKGQPQPKPGKPAPQNPGT